MAYAHVQSKVSTPAASFQSTFVSTVTSGNTIIVAVAGDSNNTFTMTDNLGNTYTNRKQVGFNSGGGFVVFTAPVTTGGTCTVTAASTGMTFCDIAIHEYSGLVGTFDTAAGAGVDTPDAGPANSGNTATTTNAIDIIFGAAAGGSARLFANDTNGYTERQNNQNDFGWCTADKRVVATGAYNFNPTFTGGTQKWASICLALQESAPATPVTGSSVIVTRHLPTPTWRVG